jgi:hypothetical protein
MVEFAAELNDEEINDSLAENGPEAKRVQSMFVQSGSKEGLLNAIRNENMLQTNNSGSNMPSDIKDFIAHEKELYEDLIYADHELIQTETVRKIHVDMKAYNLKRDELIKKSNADHFSNEVSLTKRAF